MAESNSLYSRILSQEGLKGLLLFMLSVFLMSIIYQGQQKAQATLDSIDKAAEMAAIQQIEQTKILTDIRYALREKGGLVYRNNAN